MYVAQLEHIGIEVKTGGDQPHATSLGWIGLLLLLRAPHAAAAPSGASGRSGGSSSGTGGCRRAGSASPACCRDLGALPDHCRRFSPVRVADRLPPPASSGARLPATPGRRRSRAVGRSSRPRGSRSSRAAPSAPSTAPAARGRLLLLRLLQVAQRRVHRQRQLRKRLDKAPEIEPPAVLVGGPRVGRPRRRRRPRCRVKRRRVLHQVPREAEQLREAPAVLLPAPQVPRPLLLHPPHQLLPDAPLPPVRQRRERLGAEGRGHGGLDRRELGGPAGHADVGQGALEVHDPVAHVLRARRCGAKGEPFPSASGWNPPLTHFLPTARIILSDKPRKQGAENQRREADG